MQHSNAILSALKQNIAKVVVGKDDVVELLLTALLCEGHILIEDVPGVGKTTLCSALARPFMVLATQNPVDFVGTYPLPEAQMDRFFMRISIGYPTVEDEMDILARYCGASAPMQTLSAVCSAEDVLSMQQQVKGTYASPEVRAYVAAICAATRNTPYLTLGASTRAAIALVRAAQGNALLCGRDYIIPEDVQRMAAPVLCHRFVLSADARMRGYTEQQVLSELMGGVRIPVRLK